MSLKVVLWQACIIALLVSTNLMAESSHKWLSSSTIELKYGIKIRFDGDAAFIEVNTDNRANMMLTSESDEYEFLFVDLKSLRKEFERVENTRERLVISGDGAIAHTVLLSADEIIVTTGIWKKDQTDNIVVKRPLNVGIIYLQFAANEDLGIEAMTIPYLIKDKGGNWRAHRSYDISVVTLDIRNGEIVFNETCAEAFERGVTTAEERFYLQFSTPRFALGSLVDALNDASDERDEKIAAAELVLNQFKKGIYANTWPKLVLSKALFACQ